jgi:hypothetical protein
MIKVREVGRMIRRNTGQSIVEYAILLGVVIAALLIMQMFIKRAYQGGLKESADKIGTQFSASGTTTSQNRTMSTPQVITEGVATTSLINTYAAPIGMESALDAAGQDVYSYTQRTGGKSTMTSESKTESTGMEKTRVSEYGAGETVEDFTMPAVTP